MKKVFTVMAIAIMMSAMPAMAQVKFGLKGGMNVTSMHLSSKVLDSDNKMGYYVGPTVLVQLPIVGLGIDAAALYDQREAKLKGDITTEGAAASSKVKMQSIQVPINVRYAVGLGNTASIFFFAGPQFGFNVGDKEDKAKNYKLKDSNLSVNLGLGAMLINHLQINANYNWALGKTGDSFEENVKEGFHTKKGMKASAWQIGLAYFF